MKANPAIHPAETLFCQFPCYGTKSYLIIESISIFSHHADLSGLHPHVSSTHSTPLPLSHLRLHQLKHKIRPEPKLHSLLHLIARMQQIRRLEYQHPARLRSISKRRAYPANEKVVLLRRVVWAVLSVDDGGRWKRCLLRCRAGLWRWCGPRRFASAEGVCSTAWRESFRYTWKV